jgi:hypothetical protein
MLLATAKALGARQGRRRIEVDITRQWHLGAAQLLGHRVGVGDGVAVMIDPEAAAAQKAAVNLDRRLISSSARAGWGATRCGCDRQPARRPGRSCCTRPRRDRFGDYFGKPRWRALVQLARAWAINATPASALA